MKLYDIILKNTDIENFCANEKHYYFKLLKQMINLMCNSDIVEYKIKSINEYITNLTVTDSLLNASEFTITASYDDSIRSIYSSNYENSGHDRITINKCSEKNTKTDARIPMSDNLFVDIECWNRIDQHHQALEIMTLYNGKPTNTSSWYIQRFGYFKDYKTYNFKKNNSTVLYTEDVNSLLNKIIEEDKKTIFASSKKTKVLK